MKIYKLSDINKFFHDKAVIQKPEEEIVSYINNICKDNKSCEKYYYKNLINLKNKNMLNLDNVKKIQFQFKNNQNIEFPSEQKAVLTSIQDIDPKFAPWSMKQIKNIKIEDYDKLVEDLKTYKSILDKDKNFPYRDINQIKDNNELYKLVKSFKQQAYTNNQNSAWIGEWLHIDEDVLVFESRDPETISKISIQYNTRWCIKNKEAAEKSYKCRDNPMQFVFLDSKPVCVIQKFSKQIKNVDDYALSDYGIISRIDHVLTQLNLKIDGGDFETYNKILLDGKKINKNLKESENKIEYLKSLSLDKLICIDKNLILYNNNIKDYVIDIIKDANSKDQKLPNLNPSIVQNIPEIREEYKKYWINKINTSLSEHFNCPSYIARYNEIQQVYKEQIINTLLNYRDCKRVDQIYCIEEIRKNPNILPNQYKEIYKTNKIDFYTKLFNKNLYLFFSDSSYLEDSDIVETGMTVCENKLKQDPFFYDKIPQHIRENKKYKERLEKAFDVGIFKLENLLKISPSFYDRIPQHIRENEKYKDRLEKAFDVGVFRLENKLKKDRLKEAYVVEWENKLKIYPSFYDRIPQYIRENEKYKDRLEEAYVIGLENELKKFPFSYKNIPQHIREKYKDRFAKYITQKAKNYINWYKKSNLFER